MAKEEQKEFNKDLEKWLLFSLMEWDREGIPGLRGGVSKDMEKADTRQMQKTECKASGA